MRYSITYSLKRLRQSIPVIRDRVLIFNLLFVAILTLPSYMMGQVYEIYSKTTVLPPYPITLDGFTAEGGTKLQVQITSSDITRAQYPVLLKLVIKGNGITIESKSLFVHDPVFVNGNETTLLNGSDLAVFFNPDNLNFSGYSKTQYQRNGRLPEGVYSVSFELYDEFRARQNIFINVARALPGMVFMFLNEVPSLTLPMNNEVISAAGNPSINFRWTTRHSPLAATFFTPQYLFELWDVVPQGTNPYQAVRGTRPLFATTCEATYLTYGIAETPLQPGHTYAWRVREVDPEGKTMFKNDGYTDVYTSTYGRNCPAPELSADKTGTSHFSVTWQADPSQKQFELRIRDKKKKDAEWYTLKSGLLSAKVDQLKPNTIYEAEVCAICGDQRSEYSNRLEITTRQNTSFNCGQADSSKLPQNQNPLRKLSKGDVFTASTFTVEVSEASGSNGTFTGKGFILVPYLNFIKVEAKFQNIRINEEYQLIGGEVQTVYNISNSLTAKIDGIVKTIQGDGELNPYDSKPIAGKIIKVDSVKTIKVVNGQVIVTDVNGKEETATLAKDKLVVVKTQEGSQYVVDGATNTIYTSANSGQKSAGGTPAGNITTASEAGKGTTPQFNVSFLPHSLQKYGYDIPSDKSPAENYESTNITGQPTLVPWKSLEAGRIEYVMAGITGGSADSVRYYRESNNMVMTAPGTGSNVLNGKTAPGQEFKQLLLTGTVENTTDKLFAWYPSHNEDTTKTYSRILAGQLNMASYEKKTIQVVLVQVNGSICPKANYVQDELNKIYTPAIVNWQVSYLQNGIKVTLPRTNQKLLNVNDSNKNMDYTPEMKLVIDAMQENITFNPQTIYLFFFDESTDINLKGYMPLNRKFGFIFKLNQYPDEYLRTIAHELGHGAFRLYHTFSDKNKFFQPQGSTNNLMDYAHQNSTGLYKYQWDECHDWDLGMNWGEDEEEGELITAPKLVEYIRNSNLIGIKDNIIVKDQCEMVIWNRVKIGPKRLSFLNLACSDIVDDKFPYSPANSRYTWNSNENELHFDPSEISKVDVIGVWDKKEYTLYNFHQLEIPKQLPVIPYLTDKVLFYFSVKRSEATEFEKYLFPTWENLLTQKGTLSAAQIKKVREGIETQTNTKKKEEMYLLLQSKVEYKNQRDNEPTKDLHNDGVEATADRMCNVTSLAMAFEMLGTTKDDLISIAEKGNITIPQAIKDGDSEDLLDYIRSEKKYGNRTYSSSWDSLASFIGLESETRIINSSRNIEAQTNYLSGCLKSGKGIIMSIAYEKGHIVRLQDINSNKIIIDDPYGIVNSLAKREFKGINDATNNYNGNERNMGNNGKKGEDCQLTWNEIDVSIEEEKGGKVEVNASTIVTWYRGNKVVNGSFETWLNEIAANFNEYSTRQETKTKVEKGKTITETIKYYMAKGATIKYYKIYSKPKDNEN